MKRTAIIADGMVQNVIVAGPGFKPPKGTVAVETEVASIGDEYDGSGFIQQEPEQLTKVELIDYAKLRRGMALKSGIQFDLSEPDDNPEFVQIPVSVRDEITALLWGIEHEALSIHGRPIVLVTDSQVIKLTPKQVIEIHAAIMGHIARTHVIMGNMIEAIESGNVTSIDEINSQRWSDL